MAKKKTRRIMLIVALCTILTLLCLFQTGLEVHAAEIVESGTCGKNLIWTLDDQGVLTISGTGEMGDCVVEEDEDWLYVAPWNKHCENICTIIIQEGVTSISWGAFCKVENVTEIHLPSSLKSIGAEAFNNKKNVNVHIADLQAFLSIDQDIALAGWGACWQSPEYSPMNNASLVLNGSLVKTLVIPEGITSITTALFYGCRGIETVYFPESLEDISSYAFAGSSVKNVHFIGDNIFFDFCAFSTSIKNVYVDSLENWLTYSFDTMHCDGGDGDGNRLSLSTNPLCGCENFYVGETLLTDLRIPDGTKHIEEAAFVGYDKLQHIWLPSTVADIGGAAFANCDGISQIYFAGDAPETDTVGSTCTAWCDDELCTECVSVYAFSGVTATAYYPANNTTWTEEKLQKFGGKIRWVPDDKILKITAQPKTGYAAVGKYAKTTVQATGDELTYQWYVKDVGDTKYYRSSQNTATYSCKMSATTNGRYAKCKITDKNGKYVWTDTVRLWAKASITTQPANKTVKAGATAKFTVVAVGKGLTYQWQYRTSSSGSWKNASATGNKTKTLSVAATIAKHGYQYRCKITDSAGNVIYTNVVDLYVLGIKTQPASKTVKAGATAKLTVSAVGDGLTYQWQYRTSSSGSWKNASATGNKTKTLSVAATVAKHGYQYRCKVTDIAGNTVYTSVVTLNVLGIKTQPVSKTVKAGATAKFTVAAVGDGLTYQWQYRTSSSGSWKNVSTASGKTANYSLTAAARHNGYQYRCKITDSAGNVIYTSIVKLTVK